MDKKLLHVLLGMIALSAKRATIQDVTMILIDRHTRKVLLEVDPERTLFREITLENGTFIYVVDENFTLKRLYKVVDEIPSYIKMVRK